MGDNVIAALLDSPVATWRGGRQDVYQFTFVPESSLTNDPVVALEITSDALIIPGPAEDIQLLVRVLKQSGLAEVITPKAEYTLRFPNVAKVTSGGLITPIAPGVTVVQINYTDPVSEKLFVESAIIEVTRFSDVFSVNPVSKDKVFSKGGDVWQNLTQKGR